MLTNQLKLTTLIIFSILLFLPIISHAQEGTFDVRFLIDSVDCAEDKLYFDIEVRADESGQEFHLGDQYYHFSFDRNVLENPQIVEELDVSGFMLENGELLALYSPHSLAGSIDTIVRYNVQLASGIGYYVSATDYAPVGRLSMDIIDFDAVVGLRFHKEINGPGDIPHVYVGQNYDGSITASQNGSFIDYFHDFTAICTNESSVANDDSGIVTQGEAITICLPDNDTDPENQLDLNSLSLLSTPPDSEGTVSLDADTGCLTFVPNEDFTGDVTPFEYEICNTDKYIPAYQGDANSSPIPDPDPGNPDILVTPSTCSTAMIYINVEEAITDLAVVGHHTDFGLNTFPNPADKVLNVSYVLPQKAEVSISLLNVLGQPVQELEAETLQMGTHTKSFDTSELSEGNYFIVLTIDGGTVTKGVQIK